MADQALDQLCINTIRFLAVDTVQKAKSGHPGTPMGAAPMAYALWDRFLKHNPADPTWPNRDRFVLSCGHASALLYSLLHLTGYNLPMDELKQFRQWGSKTPGHPEHGLTPGVEATTGPLGQGFGNAVGMALAERWLAGQYNRPGHEIIDHHTYALVSDGDLQEGIASEAASMAGTLGLGKLIMLYDDNDISIEGDTDITFGENVAQRFQAYGWHVIGPIEGMDVEAVSSALTAAKAETGKPSIIVCRTVIGYGSPNKAGKGSAHGDPLGEEEVVLAKENLKWAPSDAFSIPAEAGAHLGLASGRGDVKQAEWNAAFSEYREAFPEDAQQLDDALRGKLPAGWEDGLNGLFDKPDPIATRSASNVVMNAISKNVPAFIGGSADLAPSTRTILDDRGHIGNGEFSGHNLHFGVREHAMGAVANGIALHGGAIPYTATFLVFSDYMRPSIRLGAIMGQQVIYVFTHDSIGVGEDGPTHQPIEHLMALREIPGLVVSRPADATETVEVWRGAMARQDGPTVMAFTRQNLPVLDRSVLSPASGVLKGGYILWESGDSPQVVIMATGSEVHIALEAGQALDSEGIAARVVSMPSWEVFDEQPKEYRDSVLPPSLRARVSVEAGTTMGWERYVGLDGASVGMSGYGASAPAAVLYENFDITAKRVADEARKLVNGAG
ncbi:MAG: transketolase [Chloroflexi bacterium]|nr:transketolase [Dehalococcoidia bacterium]PKB81884.1 MAG: transketolase [SAR202 cluster bacterium MP-SInd-SRR3963457-G1]PKB85276.1 MAG: transketolase [SAR202 cluster bacterium MP-NPac-SRR3961935-G1]RUA29501.1 MAG: transketolase [Chloroflexota bacterium]